MNAVIIGRRLGNFSYAEEAHPMRKSVILRACQRLEIGVEHARIRACHKQREAAYALSKTFKGPV